MDSVPGVPGCRPLHIASIAYDDRNQMVQYTDLDNLRTHRSHYDCFGRRVAKVVDHGLSTAKTTRFIYGGQASWQVLAEFDGFQPGTNVPATASYAFGNYIDEPIQMRRDFDGVGPQTTKDFYYHQDELFNVVAITAGQNGTMIPRHADVYNTGDIIERIKYGDYGNPTVMQGASGTIAFTSLLGNRFMFTGREYDGETQFSYYRTRYLEHEWGRFTTRDRFGYVDGMNLLCLTKASPAVYRDPFGTDVWVEHTTAVQGFHQRICVDTWSSDCKARTGKYCISFGMIDTAGGTGSSGGSSEDGGSSDSDSSSGGSSTSTPEKYIPADLPPGTHFPIDGPDKNGDGVVYEDMRDKATETASRRQTTTCDHDKAIQAYLQSLVGQRANYALCGQNCRDFSQNAYDYITKDFLKALQAEGCNK